MIARILVKLLGGIWNVKKRCQMQNRIFSKFYIFLYNYYQFEHGSAISYKSKFNNTPVFPRGMKQIVISEDVEIGKNSVIYQQVTIDKELSINSEISAAPVIGDNCLIYPGVKIIGPIRIGDNVVIGSNVVVQTDIAASSVIRFSESQFSISVNS